MKNFFPLFALAAGLFLVSFKKERTSETGNTVAKKLTQTSIGGNLVITYNNDGRPAMTSFSPGGGFEYRKTFLYSPGKINYTVLLNNKKVEEGAYTLANGKIVSFDWTRFDDLEQPGQVNIETYTYNEKGLVEKHACNKAYSEFVYDDNANLARVSHYNSQGQATTTVEYTYTKLKDPFPAMGYFNTDGSGFFLPAFANYLPATKKVIRVSTGEVTLKGVFSYERDADGYVLKGKWDALSAGDNDLEWTNSFQ